MNTNSIDPQGFSLKSFWDRKEGTTGYIVLALLAFGGAIGLYNLLPYLITFTQNLISFMGLAIAAIAVGIPLAFIISVLLSKKTHAIVGTWFKVMMRKFTSLFVSVYPIEIIKEKIFQMKKKVEDIATALGKLLGVRNRIKNDKAAAKKELEQKITAAKLAQQKGDNKTAGVMARAVQRRQERIEMLNELEKKIEMLYNFLEKMRKNISLLVTDKEDEVQQLELKYKAVNIAHEIKTYAKAVLGEALGEDELFNLALEYVADDMTQKMGDIEEFMEVNEEIMSSLELQNEVKEAQGLELLNKYEKKLDQLIPDANSSVRVEQLLNGTRQLDLDNTQKVYNTTSKFIK